MAKTLTRTALISSQSLAAGGTQRAVIDLQGADGGAVITWAITNGGTAPSAQCEARIMGAHVSTGDSTPAAGAEGTGDQGWKRLYVMGGGTLNNAKTRGSLYVNPAWGAAQIEFTGNTAQAVTIEAHVTLLS